MDKTAVKPAAGTMGWVATMTCLQVFFLVSQLKQLTAFDDAALKIVNKSVGRALNFASVGMRVNSIYLRTFSIAAYSDASLANNADLSSQISGFIVFRDNLGNVALAHYWSRKCQRATPSTLFGEAIALNTAFDSALMLRNAVSEILGRRVFYSSLLAATRSFSSWPRVISSAIRDS
eukprot:Plantae.Rhodophyta-Palmaria_palmata.ctg3529.p1 GENE.Plantae.Rhodophyta-Palmaria_palmata.ctg3529~~Plantae.Rhodophyta-Palmaria_palmata.ctg3529.p1  ORF type:complete len:177 (+),score=14.17 Plantae.Rhodophyta-Palmaria_palmata.ctg3529:593-1123(+)